MEGTIKVGRGKGRVCLSVISWRSMKKEVLIKQQGVLLAWYICLPCFRP